MDNTRVRASGEEASVRTCVTDRIHNRSRQTRLWAVSLRHRNYDCLQPRRVYGLARFVVSHDLLFVGNPNCIRYNSHKSVLPLSLSLPFTSSLSLASFYRFPPYSPLHIISLSICQIPFSCVIHSFCAAIFVIFITVHYFLFFILCLFPMSLSVFSQTQKLQVLS